MPWTKDDERTFRKALAAEFETEAKARMLLRQAEVNVAKVDFSGGAETMWFNALSEAGRAAKLDALLAVAIEDASGKDSFAAILAKVGGVAHPIVAMPTVTPEMLAALDQRVDWAGMTGPSLARLRDALLSAFPRPDLLRQFMELSVGKSLVAFTGNGPLPTMVFDVLIDARAGGWLRDVYVAAIGASPRNQQLIAFAMGDANP